MTTKKVAPSKVAPTKTPAKVVASKSKAKSKVVASKPAAKVTATKTPATKSKVVASKPAAKVTAAKSKVKTVPPKSKDKATKGVLPKSPQILANDKTIEKLKAMVAKLRAEIENNPADLAVKALEGDLILAEGRSTVSSPLTDVEIKSFRESISEGVFVPLSKPTAAQLSDGNDYDNVPEDTKVIYGSLNQENLKKAMGDVNMNTTDLSNANAINEAITFEMAQAFNNLRKKAQAVHTGSNIELDVAAELTNTDQDGNEETVVTYITSVARHELPQHGFATKADAEYETLYSAMDKEFNLEHSQDTCQTNTLADES